MVPYTVFQAGPDLLSGLLPPLSPPPGLPSSPWIALSVSPQPVHGTGRNKDQPHI